MRGNAFFKLPNATWLHVREVGEEVTLELTKNKIKFRLVNVVYVKIVKFIFYKKNGMYVFNISSSLNINLKKISPGPQV